MFPDRKVATRVNSKPRAARLTLGSAAAPQVRQVDMVVNGTKRDQGRRGSELGPKFGPKFPITGPSEGGRNGIGAGLKPLKTASFWHQWERDGTAIVGFRDRPDRRGHAQSCCRTGLVRGLVPCRFIQQAQRVVGLSCISRCISRRQPRLLPRSDTDLARWIPPANDQPCVITTLPKWPRPSKWR
jgi:hypothetical protein